MTVHTNDSDYELRAEEVMRKSGVDAIALMLFDQRSSNHPIQMIKTWGIPGSISARYVDGICRSDPLLPHASSSEKAMLLSTRVGAKPKSDFSQPVPDLHYHRMLETAGYVETAACSYQVSRHIYAVVGLLLNRSQGRRSGILIDVALPSLEDWLILVTGDIRESAVRNVYFPKEESGPANCDEMPGLTRREEQVVAELQKGLGNKQIADRLSLSRYTVENHLRRIYQKFDVHNRTALMAKLGAGLAIN